VREVIEENQGQKKDKNTAKEVNQGLQPKLVEFKTTLGGSTTWGELYACISKDKRVLQFARKDHNMVLFMTTASKPDDRVILKRLRPTPKVISTRSSRVVFGNEAINGLSIPQ